VVVAEEFEHLVAKRGIRLRARDELGTHRGGLQECFEEQALRALVTVGLDARPPNGSRAVPANKRKPTSRTGLRPRALDGLRRFRITAGPGRRHTQRWVEEAAGSVIDAVGRHVAMPSEARSMAPTSGDRRSLARHTLVGMPSGFRAWTVMPSSLLCAGLQRAPGRRGAGFHAETPCGRTMRLSFTRAILTRLGEASSMREVRRPACGTPMHDAPAGGASAIVAALRRLPGWVDGGDRAELTDTRRPAPSAAPSR
jgi:hypothetical protein